MKLWFTAMRLAVSDPAELATLVTVEACGSQAADHVRRGVVPAPSPVRVPAPQGSWPLPRACRWPPRLARRIVRARPIPTKHTAPYRQLHGVRWKLQVKFSLQGDGQAQRPAPLVLGGAQGGGLQGLLQRCNRRAAGLKAMGVV